MTRPYAAWRSPEREELLFRLYRQNAPAREIFARINALPGPKARTYKQLQLACTAAGITRPRLNEWRTPERWAVIKRELPAGTGPKVIQAMLAELPGAPMPVWENVLKVAYANGIYSPRTLRRERTVTLREELKEKAANVPPRKCLRCRVTFGPSHRGNFLCGNCSEYAGHNQYAFA